MEPVLWNRLHFLYRSGKIVRMNTSIDISHIRNFSIVAHIDHGKSTISDRILELTHTVDERDMESQLLDTMDIERERGITIKSNSVRVSYDADDGETYQFNLIDTPGHVDFTYEVSRSLAACEGAVLVVDATQGVEAQTVSNATLAMNANLDIVPAINKIDLPSAHPDEVKTEIEDDLAIPADDAVCVPFGSGCSAVVTQAVRENRRGGRSVFLALFDPSVRPWVDASELGFAFARDVRHDACKLSFRDPCVEQGPGPH